MAATGDDDYVAYVTARMPVLRRIATQLAGDAHRGDDLVQQAITRLYLHWRRAAESENLDAYVYKIIVRAFLDQRRLRWSSVRLGIPPGDPEFPDDRTTTRAGDPAALVADRMLLREALATLPPKQRAVVVLRYLADLSVEQVAEMLHISTGTVKSQTHDGLAALRRLLGPVAWIDTPGASR